MIHFSIGQIDKGIYEALRLVLVEKGYTPDVLIANTPSLYATALQAIKGSGKQPIELYGVGSWDAKKELKVSTIIIDRESESLSNLGYKGIVYYEEKAGGGFTKKQTPLKTVVLGYTITFVCFDAKNERIIQHLIDIAFDGVKQLNGYNDDGTQTQNKFLIFENGKVNVSDRDFIEHQIKLTTSELFLTDDIVLESNVSEIGNIEFEL